MLLRSAADNQTATEQLLKNFNIEDKDQKDQLAKLKKIPAKELADFAFKMTTVSLKLLVLKKIEQLEKNFCGFLLIVQPTFYKLFFCKTISKLYSFYKT